MHSNNEQKLLTPVAELRKSWEEAEEEGNPVGGPAVSRQDLSNTGPTTRQHTAADMSPPHTHTADDCQVWVQSETMHLILKRLEAPGSLEVRWGESLGHPHGDRMGWGGGVG